MDGHYQAHYLPASRSYTVDKIGYNYSRTSLMWTAKGQTKSVHNSEVSTLVNLGVAMGYRAHFESLGYHVHVEQVSIGVDCPQRRDVHKVGFYCN